VEFLRALPTVWDETVVLEGEAAKSVFIARRAGNRWYLAAMNGDEAAQLQVPLKFLGKGKWTLRRFSDNTGSSKYQAVVETSLGVDAKAVVSLSLLPAGGFVGILSKTD
jgi:alpha-glucosidase